MMVSLLTSSSESSNGVVVVVVSVVIVSSYFLSSSSSTSSSLLSRRKGTTVGILWFMFMFLFVLSCRNGGWSMVSCRKSTMVGILWFVLSCRKGTAVGFRRNCCLRRCLRRSVIKDFKKLLPRIEVLFTINETLTISLEWGSGGKAWLSWFVVLPFKGNNWIENPILIRDQNRILRGILRGCSTRFSFKVNSISNSRRAVL